MFVGYSHNYDSNCYCMHDPKIQWVSEARDTIWMKLMHYNPETKVEHESRKFLEGIPDVGMTVGAGKQKISTVI